MSMDLRFKGGREPASDVLGPTGRLANWLEGLTLDAVPREVQERAKHVILDGIACALVGAKLPWSQTAVETVTRFEGRGERDHSWGDRDWWLWGPANCCDGPLWRLGFDFGGRYGSGSARFHEIRHRTDVMGGVWVGVHSDCEIPCGCGWFVGSVRLKINWK